MLEILTYVAILFGCVSVATWFVLGVVIAIDQELGIVAFRERVRSRFFRDVLLWPLAINPLKWPGLLLLVLAYPLIYLVRSQVVGCFVREPLKPSVALGKPGEAIESCSKSFIENALQQHPGAYTTL